MVEDRERPEKRVARTAALDSAQSDWGVLQQNWIPKLSTTDETSLTITLQRLLGIESGEVNQWQQLALQFSRRNTARREYGQDGSTRHFDDSKRC